MTRRMRLAVAVWPWVLALVVLGPALLPGYVLSYDMVFVPDLTLRSDFLGFGSALPRAVPSDAVVAVLDEVVPGMLLQKLVLLGSIVLAGMGARRLVAEDNGVAQLAATSLYVWNPYVAERLGIGHWPVLLAYAALPWVFDTARRVSDGRRAMPTLVLWMALGAMSAAGGIMTAFVAVLGVAGLDGAALRRTGAVVAAALAVNAPWLFTGILHGAAALTDPQGVAAFATRGEGLLPTPLAALGLGGIWNSEVVPVTRLGWAAVVMLCLTVAVAAAGFRQWARQVPRRTRLAMVGTGVAGFWIALVGALLPDFLEWVVANVPGGGLLRDGSRFLALLAPLEAALFGHGAAVLAGLLRERLASASLAVGAVLAPLALMPDLAWGLAGQLNPVHFPEEYSEARSALLSLGATDGDETLLVLPLSSYRVPDWNQGRRTLDPLGRFMPTNYVASDVLYVSGERLRGEDRLAARVADTLGASRSRAELSAALGAEGISWVLLDRDAAAAPGQLGSTGDLGAEDLVFAGDDLRLWRLDNVDAKRSSTFSKLAVVTSAWSLALLTVIGALAAMTRRRVSRHNASAG